MMACASAGPTLSIALLAAAAVFFGMLIPNLFAVAQPLAGRARRPGMGIQNLVGNLREWSRRLHAGTSSDRTGHFYWAFGHRSGNHARRPRLRSVS